VSDNTNCSTNNLTGSPLTGIGQTWSTPNLFFQSTYSTTKPVIVMGAGYDTCEDADSVTTDSSFCSGAKGAGVYVIDSDTGAIIRTFDTLRSVASEVALVDVNGDGVVDLAYAADTGGNIYRIKFSDTSTFQPLASSDWSITRVAYTSGGSRKFLFAPALLPLQGKVYVAIGSGDREHPTILSYPYTTPVTNRFYVYVDDPTSSTLTNLDSMVNYTVSSTDTCDTTPILPTSTAKGWFMDLTEHGPGEQTVTSAIIQGGMVAFSTNRPVASGNSCTNGLGEARGYWVNLLNGSGAISTTDNKTCGGDRSSIFVGGGLPPSPVTGVVTVNGVPQNIVIGAAQRDGSTSTPVGAQKNNPPINTKRSRVYWNVQTDTR
jgi:Tfp pilus tip-associated adhesin PilY1